MGSALSTYCMSARLTAVGICWNVESVPRYDRALETFTGLQGPHHVLTVCLETDLHIKTRFSSGWSKSYLQLSSLFKKPQIHVVSD